MTIRLRHEPATYSDDHAPLRFILALIAVATLPMAGQMILDSPDTTQPRPAVHCTQMPDEVTPC